MGSPISGVIAEISLQHLEKIYIKHWLQSEELLFYNRYVDDVIIIYDSRKTETSRIETKLNSINRKLSFNGTEAENEQINYLDLIIK